MGHMNNLHHLKQIISLKVFLLLIHKLQCHSLCINLAPPPHPVLTCFIADDPVSLIFYWDNYNSDSVIDHFCVTTSPSTSCSMCGISPHDPYICSGLQGGQQYSFEVKAVNCENQAGESINLTVSLESKVYHFS